MCKAVIFLFGLMAVAAFPRNTQRIMGGSPTTIREYPEMASLLYAYGLASHTQACGGAILTRGAILTAAHCTSSDPVTRWRSRLGSTFANNGGVIFQTARIINHREFLWHTGDYDIAIIHVLGQIRFTTTIRPGIFAGTSYFIRDDHEVWAAGWGATGHGLPTSEQLRHVKMWVINQDICRDRYARLSRQVTDNMLCVGWLDVGGRDQCGGDSGGPLYHNGVIVGLSSWGYSCGLPEFPGVNTRVQRFAFWILEHVYEYNLYNGDLQFV